MIKWRCDGLTEELWDQWVQDPELVSITTNTKLTRHELPDDEGHKVNLLKMPMPYPMAGRSTLTTFYHYEKEDGTKVVLSSSKGNEQLVEANQGLIGRDV